VSLGLCGNGGLTFTFEVGPLAGLDEVGPVEGMEFGISFEHVELNLSQRFAAAQALLEVSIIAGHQFARRVIAHRPKSHDQRFRARQDESASEAIDTFAVANFTHPSIASRKDDQFRAPKIQTRRFQGSENPVVIGRILPKVGAGQRQTRAQQRVLDVGLGANSAGCARGGWPVRRWRYSPVAARCDR